MALSTCVKCGNHIREDHMIPVILAMAIVVLLGMTPPVFAAGGKGTPCNAMDAGGDPWGGGGSASCGGSLVCRNVGQDYYRCVGGGQKGDLCAASEAGKGSGTCTGNF